MDVYSLNPNIMPAAPMSRKDHHRATVVAIVIFLAALAVGIAYWLGTPASEYRPAASDQRSLERAQMSSILRTSGVSATQADIDRMAALLSKSKASASQADKESVSAVLKTYNNQ